MIKWDPGSTVHGPRSTRHRPSKGAGVYKSFARTHLGPLRPVCGNRPHGGSCSTTGRCKVIETSGRKVVRGREGGMGWVGGRSGGERGKSERERERGEAGGESRGASRWTAHI